MLRAETLSFTYNHLPLLRDISFELNLGELLAIIGPNGVGKSTLVKLISGVLTGQAGKVFLNEKPIHKLTDSARARQLAVVSQNIALPAAFTTWEVTLLGRTPYLDWLGNTGSADEAIALDALRSLGLSHLKDRYIHQLSGGEKQLLMLARALTQQAPVLILDEPTANLDMKHQVEVLSHVKKLVAQKQVAGLVVMHDLNLVAQFADRVLLLATGGHFYIGRPEEVLTEARLSDTYGLPIKVYPHNGCTPFFVQPLPLYSTK